MKTQRRPEGRTSQDPRPIRIETGVNRYAEGSARIHVGETIVLCTASIEESVPGWMKGKGKGWISSEYSMLPRATHTRNKRDREKVSGRTQEIQRLIGRSLRSIVNMDKIGERSILIDCDVLQADGGTRTASITGGCVALILALNKLQAQIKSSERLWIDTVAAVSVGMHSGQVLVDLDYEEDSTCEIDMNIVMTGNGRFIEVQGTAEKGSFSPEDLSAMTSHASKCLETIKLIQLRHLTS